MVIASRVHARAICRCACGKEIDIRISALHYGTVSCGCKRRRHLKDNRGHGQSKDGGTQEFNAWRSMRQRCCNPNNINYYRYGGRGITICKAWEYFENFFQEMGKCPHPGWTVERKDVNAGYCKDNCVWADMTTQCNNRRSNRFETWNGKTQTVAQWAREYAVSSVCLYKRLLKGWALEQALTTPLRTPRTITADGITKTVAQWAADLGLSSKAIKLRIKAGQSPEDAVRRPSQRKPRTTA
jgi:hypothetical protein